MGTVYFLEAPSVGLVKIGFTTDLEKRIRSLENMSPVRLILRATIDEVNKRVEGDIHKAFEEDRRHGEWFSVTDDLRCLMDDPDSFDLKEYRELVDQEELTNFLESVDGDYIILFGKHNGELVSSVIKDDYQYIDWMLWKTDFPTCVQESIAEMIELYSPGDNDAKTRKAEYRHEVGSNPKQSR